VLAIAIFAGMKIEVRGEEFELWPQKAMYWKRINTLLVADLHLGKVNHFRKAGIAVPSKANDKNIENLVHLLQELAPTRIICLGDLFHSHYNPEWEVFGEVVSYFQSSSFELVLGNHDIMSEVQYQRKGIVLHEQLSIGNFIFTHHPLENVESGQYNIAGHLHPGVYLSGKGKQSLTLPCFYFGENQGLLPAFGSFTGLARVHPKKNDKIFAILEDRVIPVG